MLTTSLQLCVFFLLRLLQLLLEPNHIILVRLVCARAVAHVFWPKWTSHWIYGHLIHHLGPTIVSRRWTAVSGCGRCEAKTARLFKKVQAIISLYENTLIYGIRVNNHFAYLVPRRVHISLSECQRIAACQYFISLLVYWIIITHMTYDHFRINNNK